MRRKRRATATARVPLESTLHAAVDPRLSSFRASMHRKSGACWDAFHGRSAACFPRARLASFVRQAVIPPTFLRLDWASNAHIGTGTGYPRFRSCAILQTRPSGFNEYTSSKEKDWNILENLYVTCVWTRRA